MLIISWLFHDNKIIHINHTKTSPKAAFHKQPLSFYVLFLSVYTPGESGVAAERSSKPTSKTGDASIC